MDIIVTEIADSQIEFVQVLTKYPLRDFRYYHFVWFCASVFGLNQIKVIQTRLFSLAILLPRAMYKVHSEPSLKALIVCFDANV